MASTLPCESHLAKAALLDVVEKPAGKVFRRAPVPPVLVPRVAALEPLERVALTLLRRQRMAESAVHMRCLCAEGIERCCQRGGLRLRRRHLHGQDGSRLVRGRKLCLKLLKLMD